MKTLAIVTLTAFFLASPASAMAALPSQGQVRSIVQTQALHVAKSSGVLLDPRLVNGMVESALLYAANFCVAGEAPCPGVNDPEVLLPQIQGYLDELRGLPQTAIRVLGDRLADGDFSSIGYPSQNLEPVGLVKLPLEWSDAVITVHFASSSVRLDRWQPEFLGLEGPLAIEANRNGERERLQVLIEPFTTIQLHSKQAPASAAIAPPLQLLPSAYCSKNTPLSFTGPFAVFNGGHAIIEEDEASRRHYASPILRSHVIDIDLQVAPTVECSEQCRDSLSLLFADAVATWKKGCDRCEPDSLVMVRTQSSTWLNTRLIQRLRMRSEGKAVSLRLKDLIENDRPAFTSTDPLSDLSSETIAAKQLCETADDDADWVKPAKAAFCGAPAEALVEGILRPRIQIMEGTHSCGDVAVACGLPDAGIEINANYRFTTPSVLDHTPLLIGNPKGSQVLNLRSVILHEVGHWFGVPHAEVGKSEAFLDIMAQTYGDGQPCLSEQSLRMTANAGDLRWTYRVSQGGALMPPTAPSR